MVSLPLQDLMFMFSSNSLSLLHTRIPVISTGRRAPVMKTAKVRVTLNKDETKDPFRTYNMLITNDSTSLEPDDVLHMIQSDKEKVIEECLREGDPIDRENVWRGNHAFRSYSEEQMVRGSENDKASLCVLNQKGM